MAEKSAPIKVAAVQMCSGPDVAANLAAAEPLLEQGQAAGARVLVLPENFSFIGAHDADKRAIAEPLGHGPVQDFLAAVARRLGVWIVAGTTPISRGVGERVAQSLLVYRDDGSLAERYDKIHLFDVDIPGRAERYRESANIAPGERAVLVPTPAGVLGLSICYDMRFPELYRQLSAAGAQWFAVPAAFTVPTGRAHWEVLLRARAIENLAYVVAPGQCGQHANGRETYGHSLICDYWGTVLACREQGPGVVVAEFDLTQQAETRVHFPALQHRIL